MAIGDPQLDPLLAFGTPESTPPAAPWSWVPEAWRGGAPLLEDPPIAPELGVPAPVIPAPLQPVPPGPEGPPLPPIEPFDIPPAFPAPAPEPEPPAPPLPAPDAITSADPGPLPPIEPEQLDVAPVTIEDQWARDPLRSPNADQRRAAAAELAVDPVRLAQMEIDQAAARKAFEAAELVRAEEETLRQLKANQAARRAADEVAQRKSDQIVADAVALSQREIDPDRLTSRMSGGQTFAQILALAFGGLVAGKTGGPNSAMELFQRRVDRDIAAQRADIENARFGIDARRGAVAQEFARSGDAYQAAETVRLAIYQSAINLMKTRQQDLDPRGTQSIALAGEIRDLSGRMAAAQEVQRKTIFDEEHKTKLLKLQQEQQAETARNNRAQNVLRARELAEQRKQREAAAQAKAEEKAAEKADKEEERDRQFTVSVPRPAIALDDKGKPVIGPDGKPVMLTQRLTNKDGKTWRLGSNEETAAMKAKIAAAAEITDMIDEVLDIRAKVGGEIMPWSDAKQRLALLQERMRLVRKSGTQGMSSDKDFEALGASIGASNLNSFIDQSPGLKEARERTVAELNTQMLTANYSGPALTFENKYGEATNTPEDDRRKRLLEASDETLSGLTQLEMDKRFDADRQAGLDVESAEYRASPGYQAILRESAETARKSFDPGASVAQRADIAALGIAAAAGDAAALAVLNEIATKGHTGRLREIAKAQIDALKPVTVQPGPRSAPVVVPDDLRLP